MPSTTKECPRKQAIDDEAKEAKGHIDKVLTDAPSLAPSLKSELDLAKQHLDTICKDIHTA
jgi:hypothetical protein